MIKRTNNVVKVFFSILLVVSLTAAANDPFKKFKWTVGVGQDSSNPFDPIDPESVLVTDPAYSAQDPASELLTDPSYSAQDPESVEITNKIVGRAYATSSKKEVITGDTKVERESSKRVSERFDSAGNTVTEVFKVTENVTSVPITTTTTTTTTRTTTYEDGSTSTKVTARNIAKNTTNKEVSRKEEKRELISTKVTPNVKKTWFTTKENSIINTKKPTVSTTYIDEKIQSTDENGSTVIDTYRTFTDTVTTPTVTTVKTTTTEHTLWTDGETITSDITTSKDSPISNVVTTKKREEHVDQTIIPHVVSTEDIEEVTTETIKGKPIIASVCNPDKIERYKDNNNNTIIKVSKTCENTITTPITTIETTTKKINTLWTNKNITSEVVGTNKRKSIDGKDSETNTSTDIQEIKFKEINNTEGKAKVKDVLSDLGYDEGRLKGLSPSDLRELSDKICNELKMEAIGLTPIFYPSTHNWNKLSGFQLLYKMINKCTTKEFF